jgi:hypothetical protein
MEITKGEVEEWVRLHTTIHFCFYRFGIVIACRGLCVRVCMCTCPSVYRISFGFRKYSMLCHRYLGHSIGCLTEDISETTYMSIPKYTDLLSACDRTFHERYFEITGLLWCSYVLWRLLYETKNEASNCGRTSLIQRRSFSVYLATFSLAKII